MKKGRLIGITLLVGIAFAVASWPVGLLSYFYASSLEDDWQGATTKAELEKHLRLYSERIIDPKNSLWGHHHSLTRNERMVQYMILWSQPLDVVYDDQNNIKMVYTSYE